MGSHDSIAWTAMDDALFRFSLTDKRQISEEIRPIVRANWRAGRVDSFMADNAIVSADAYVAHVAAMYVEWHATVDRLLFERDQQYWNKWYRQLFNWAIGYLIRKVGRRAAWMDEVAHGYVHEIVEALLRDSAHYSYQAPFDRWLHRVTRFRCGKGARRIASCQGQFERAMLPLGEWNQEQEADRGAYSPEESYILYHELPQALARLSAPDRALVYWHYYRGLPLKEVATQLDCTPQAVYNRHDRIKKKLGAFITQTG